MENTSPKNISEETVKQFIQEQYGLISHAPLEKKGDGIENAAWLIPTENDTYIIKIFEKSQDTETDVREEILLYKYLIKNSIHVPQVVGTRSGEKVSSIQHKEITYPAIVMKYEELKRYSSSELSKKQLANLATTIAYMHKALMTYPRINKLNHTTQDAISIYNHSINDFDRFIYSPNMRSRYLTDHVRLRRIHTEAVYYLQQQNLEEEFTRSVLHNDLALGHLLFYPTDEIYIFDFSDFVYGPIALDLGVLFFNLYREGNISIDQWKNMTGEFLTEYCIVLPLSENDKHAIELFTISRLLEHIRYLNSRSTKLGHAVDDHGVMKRYELLESLYLKTA